MCAFLFYLFSLTYLTPATQASTWEVGVIFLGANESPDFQKDIDQNILELARLNPNDQFKLKIMRELPDRSVIYTPDARSPNLTSWDPLFFQPPLAGVLIPGPFQVNQKGDSVIESIIRSPLVIQNFFKDLFVDQMAKRVLILYGHGLAFNGLKTISLKELRENLEEALPKRVEGQKQLDLLWLDACFMASVEVGYELRNLAHLMIASEDAEFSAGAPFQSLKYLEQGPDDLLAASKQLAESFIESYSYLQKGSQRRAVYKSSATISVLQLDKFQPLVEKVKEVTQSFGGSLSADFKRKLKSSVDKRRTDFVENVDFGSFLRTLGATRGVPESAKRSINEVLNLIEFKSLPRIKTSPKVSIELSQFRSLLVFGYDDWTLGFEGDQMTMGTLPKELKPDGFLRGPNGKSWPYLEMSKKHVPSTFSFSPFSAGPRRFNYFLADPATKRMIGNFEIFERTQDYFMTHAARPDNPILLTGYTQGVGAYAERYSGLGILDPSLGATSINYLKTDFAEATGWGGF